MGEKLGSAEAAIGPGGRLASPHLAMNRPSQFPAFSLRHSGIPLRHSSESWNLLA
jgi:hypothetical protein